MQTQPQSIWNSPQFHEVDVCACVCSITQSYMTLWGHTDPMDCSLPGSSVRGVSQQKYWSWVAIPFCRRSHTTQLTHCERLSNSGKSQLLAAKRLKYYERVQWEAHRLLITQSTDHEDRTCLSSNTSSATYRFCNFGKLLKLSEPQFPCLSNRNENLSCMEEIRRIK